MSGANAAIDENGTRTLLAVSSTDNETRVRLLADPVTQRLLVQQYVYQGAGAPSSTPTSVGQMYVDTAAAKVYVSTGTSSSSDWTILN